MSDFRDGIDWNAAVTRLRLSCTGQALDIQVVWMFEVLAIQLFLIAKGTPLVTRLSKSWRLTHRDMRKLAPEVGLRISTVQRLSTYRDTFCHFGFLDAKLLLQDFLLKTDSDELDRLQQYTGVTLNLRNQLSM